MFAKKTKTGAESVTMTMMTFRNIMRAVLGTMMIYCKDGGKSSADSECMRQLAHALSSEIVCW